MKYTLGAKLFIAGLIGALIGTVAAMLMAA